MNIGILDYGSGNFRSVCNAVKLITPKYISITRPEDFKVCSHIILPGVGAFNYAMNKIKKLNLIDSLNKEVIITKKPFLGICIGMQIMAEKGFEFGTFEGLKWMEGEVHKFNFDNSEQFMLPHIGWNNILNPENGTLFKNINMSDPTFYFVHSYHLVSDSKKEKFIYCNYGYDFIASVEYENIFGVQFHPEKSQRNGIQLLKNFIYLND